jgi:hypothetical protein
MKTLQSVLLRTLILSLVVFAACREEDANQPPGNGNGGSVPDGMTRLYGNVLDSTGQPVAGVALHVVYPVDGAHVNQVMNGSDVLLFDTMQVLTTECNGSVPLQDGISVKIYWDENNNGIADSTDPQPPLCTDPPNCAGTVNYNEFPMNGGAMLGVPGWFVVENDFNTIGDVLTPNRFFLRIFCTDGHVLWTSELVQFPPGPSEYGFHGFVCTACSGIPEIPEWRLDQGYPNPTVDSAIVTFGLEQAAQALITLREASSNRLDTLLNEARTAGSHRITVHLDNRANGLFEYHFSAGSFGQTDALLKNESDHNVLRVTPEIALTEGNGSYRFNTAAGVTMDRRGQGNENLGIVLLDQVRLIAIKSGYQDLDTTLAITSAESLRVDLTLRAP